MIKNQEEILQHYQIELHRRGVNKKFSEVLAHKMLDIHLTIDEETKGQYRGDIATELQLGVLQDVILQFVVKAKSK
ncbi:hypothetical protein [Pedobacter aquatilis]|uniref:hypothetical protein n=1 Tax=Pedobacter aquatilis TaxID=351343 RepID=UPI002931AA5B|nr:hypothetical protein [Pedobacter aquatilis]